MKTIIFILLKLVEVAGAVAVYCGISYLGHLINVATGAENEALHMFNPINFLMVLVITFICVFAVYAVYAFFFEFIPWFIDINNKWANTITWKIKDRQGK